MTDPPRRRWLQLHLSTVIALTLTAGAVLLTNFYPRNANHDDIDNVICELNNDFQIEYSMLIYNNSQWKGIAKRYGWPFVAAGHFEWSDRQRTIFYWPGIGVDTLLAILMMVLFTFVVEWLVRRRKRVPNA